MIKHFTVTKKKREENNVSMPNIVITYLPSRNTIIETGNTSTYVFDLLLTDDEFKNSFWYNVNLILSDNKMNITDVNYMIGDIMIKYDNNDPYYDMLFIGKVDDKYDVSILRYKDKENIKINVLECNQFDDDYDKLNNKNTNDGNDSDTHGNEKCSYCSCCTLM